MVPTAGLCVSLRVLPRHVFMPFQTALAVSRSLQALGFARPFGPVRGSSWGGAEAGERLPVRCLRRAGHSPRVTSRPLGGRHVVRAADIISRSANRRKGQDDSHTCRRTPCFTAHTTPPWLACADVAQMAHTGGVTRLRARSVAAGLAGARTRARRGLGAAASLPSRWARSMRRSGLSQLSVTRA